jgi:hypothetical protein
MFQFWKLDPGISGAGKTGRTSQLFFKLRKNRRIMAAIIKPAKIKNKRCMEMSSVSSLYKEFRVKIKEKYYYV